MLTDAASRNGHQRVVHCVHEEGAYDLQSNCRLAPAVLPLNLVARDMGRSA